MSFTATPQEIPAVLLITYPRFADARGFFAETYRAGEMERLGLPPLVQDNQSRSGQGVLRGLHYQLEPAAIGKLVRCVRGRIFDVAVDLRRGSPTFAQWVAAELSEEANQMFWVPAGFAHGFCVTSESAEIAYKMSGYYAPEHERAICWDDPEIAIDWPIVEPVLSAKDAAAPALHAAEYNFAYAPPP